MLLLQKPRASTKNIGIKTAQSMQEYGFSLTRILPYKDRIE